MRHEIIVSTSTAGQVPFLDQAIEKGIVSVGLSYEITEIAESRKRTGWILRSERFIIFIFKSAAIAEVLLETCEKLVETNPAPALYCEVNDDTVDGFSLWLEDAEPRAWTKGKKFNILERYAALALLKTSTKRTKG